MGNCYQCVHIYNTKGSNSFACSLHHNPINSSSLSTDCSCCVISNTSGHRCSDCKNTLYRNSDSGDTEFMCKGRMNGTIMKGSLQYYACICDDYNPIDRSTVIETKVDSIFEPMWSGVYKSILTNAQFTHLRSVPKELLKQFFIIACTTGFMKYAGILGEATPDKEAIKVWKFDDAPPEYKLLSTNGGDEDWVAFVPRKFVGEYIAWLDSNQFGCAGVQTIEVDDGTIYIGCHS